MLCRADNYYMLHHLRRLVLLRLADPLSLVIPVAETVRDLLANKHKQHE